MPPELHVAAAARRRRLTEKGPGLHSQALILFYAFLVLAVFSSLLMGGAPERLGAVIIIVLFGLEFVARVSGPSRLYSVDPVAVVIDSLGIMSFGALALYARRAWPIWATALQILSLTSHFAQGVDPGVHPGIYIVMKSGPTFLVFVVLAVGTAFHQRRLRRQGSDPAWMGW
jgi:hypothetical protein